MTPRDTVHKHSYTAVRGVPQKGADEARHGLRLARRLLAEDAHGLVATLRLELQEQGLGADWERARWKGTARPEGLGIQP